MESMHESNRFSGIFDSFLKMYYTIHIVTIFTMNRDSLISEILFCIHSLQKLYNRTHVSNSLYSDDTHFRMFLNSLDEAALFEVYSEITNATLLSAQNLEQSQKNTERKIRLSMEANDARKEVQTLDETLFV